MSVIYYLISCQNFINKSPVGILAVRTVISSELFGALTLCQTNRDLTMAQKTCLLKSSCHPPCLAATAT